MNPDWTEEQKATYLINCVLDDQKIKDLIVEDNIKSEEKRNANNNLEKNK